MIHPAVRTSLVIVSAILLRCSGYTVDSDHKLEANGSRYHDLSYNCSLPSSIFKTLPPSLDTLENNSLFTYWRPRAHFIAPNSWQNDPMNLWVDRNGANGSLRWHVGYQYHHAHVQWGNISQGAAESSDFVTWRDIGPDTLNPANLAPSEPYDHLGVFDGTHIPAADGHPGFPSMIYTSVSQLPTAWNIPYINGTESQSLVWTEDNGTTWKRFESNPIIPHPPEDINVTGWRDPFVFKSTHLDAVLASNATANNLYLTLSSGERPTVGPRVLLYHQSNPADLSSWDYIGPLYAPTGNTDFGPWGGNVGFNFEVVNVVRLDENGDAGTRAVSTSDDIFDFVIAGAQGARADHNGNWPLWVGGTIVANGTGASLNQTFSGVGDWGTAYACLSFLDDESQFAPRRLMYCWIYEGDNGTNEGLKARGWNGALSTPRELFLKVTRNVTSPASLVNERGSWGSRIEDNGSTSVFTLGQVRAREVESSVRSLAARHWAEDARVVDADDLQNASTSALGTFIPLAVQPSSRHYEIYTSISFDTNATSGAAGIYILASGNPSEATNSSLLEYTTISYDLASETLTVNRSASSLVKNLSQINDAGKLRLWNVGGSESAGTTNTTATGARESLCLVVNVDNSFVEVYANSELVISSRIYPWLGASVNAGFFIPPGSSGKISYGQTQIWEGTYNAWPERQINTSVPLVWDGPDVPWDGY